MIERIPFAEAISEPLLFKKGFDRLSPPQQAVLKIIYGLPLDAAGLRYWSAFMGEGIYDELGFLTDVRKAVPYVPQEYADITLIIGRRAGKTSAISSAVIAYEALCGGHKKFVGEKQDPVYLQVAQDLQTAKENLRQFIFEWLDGSPIGHKELQYFGASGRTADTIRLRHARITVGPPSVKLRSQAIACCAMDELGVWPKDRESANPDVEVQRAVEPALLQFFPFDKIVKTSTPMTEEGLLWQAAQTGTRGQFLAPERQGAYARTLVLRMPTAAMENPAMNREAGGARVFLSEKRQKDAEAFPREYLAQFSKSVAGYLSTDLLRAAVSVGVLARAAEPGQFYMAALDPAFKRDAFAFCIGHLQYGQFVQDYVHSWKGSKDQPLRPGAVMDEIAAMCGMYGIRVVTSDQYHSETLMELAMTRGLIVEPMPMTLEVKHRIWTNFNSLLLQRKIRLVDHPEMLEELMMLERVLTKFGNLQFFGKRDDLAIVTALCCFKAVQMGEPAGARKTAAKPMAQTIRERVQRRVRAERDGEMDSAWFLR